MTDTAIAPTPAQERMAAARAARAEKLAAVKAEGALSLSPDLVAQATAQKAERESAERAEAERQAAVAVASETRTAPVGPSARARAAEAAKLEEEAKFDRARTLAGGVEEEGVKVRVTKTGHNKVHKGIHVAGIGDVYYAWKDEPSFPLAIAQRLEDRGLVEILEA
jgi:hypothetical protein